VAPPGEFISTILAENINAKFFEDGQKILVEKHPEIRL